MGIPENFREGMARVYRDNCIYHQHHLQAAQFFDNMFEICINLDTPKIGMLIGGAHSFFSNIKMETFFSKRN